MTVAAGRSASDHFRQWRFVVFGLFRFKPTSNLSLYPRRSRIWSIERATFAFVLFWRDWRYMCDSETSRIDAAEASFTR
jgi:hypothetical protein